MTFDGAQPIISRVSRDDIGAMFMPELQESANAIHEGRQPFVTVGNGRKVLHVLDPLLIAA